MFARIMGVALLLGCGLAILGERGTGADEKPAAGKIVLGLDKWISVALSTKKRIGKVVVKDAGIVNIIPGGRGGEPRYYRFADGNPLADDKAAPANTKQFHLLTMRAFVGATDSLEQICLHGLAVGKTDLTLTGEDDKSENFQIKVRREHRIPSGISYLVPSPTMKRIAKVAVDDAKIIKASLDAKAESVQIESLVMGETTLRLTDSEGTVEPVVIQVRKPTLMLAEGEQKKLQMMKKQMLTVIANDNDRVLKVQPTEPSTVEIEAIGPGISNLVLIGTDKTEERFEVGVKPKAK